MQPLGLVGDIARWIDSCAVHPAPLLSVAAALSVVGVMCGRRYSLKSGLRTCTYVVGVAGSGVGKEVGRQCVMSLLDRVGVPERIGTGGIASGAGLVARLVEHPTQLFLLDEFGRLLEAFSHERAASHEREIMTTFMQLWSSAPGVFKGKAYAERDTPVVQMPHTCLYGTTTPDAFYASLKGRDIVDGVMSRMLVMEVDHGQQPQVDPTSSVGEPPEDIVQRCKALVAGNAFGNLATLDSSATRVTPTVIRMEAKAEAWLRKIGAGLTAKINSAEHGELWVRANEQTQRVALAHALGRGELEIGFLDVQWAWDLVRWCLLRIDDAVDARVAETDEGRCKLAILAAIDAADGELCGRDLARHKLVRRYDTRMRKQAVGALLDEERITMQTVASTEEAGGRPLVMYSRAVEPEVV